MGAPTSTCPDPTELGTVPEHAAHLESCAPCRVVSQLLEDRRGTPEAEESNECAHFERLLAVGDGLGPGARDLLDAHLESCIPCNANAKTLAPADIYRGVALAESAGYVLREEVARGGMGRIVLADDLRIGRTVAIKELISRSPQHAARFEREARITARLQHPGIVPIYEIGRRPDGTPFYAMRLVEGQTLRDALAEKDSVEDRLELLPAIVAAAEAVAFAHSKGVIHRDLTPNNVLVGAYGDTVVIDWGLAKKINTEDDTEDHDNATGASWTIEASPVKRAATDGLTMVGSVMGTAMYMSPEQARGDPVDARGDVYTLGALLYLLLAGVPAYTGSSNQEIIDQVLHKAPRPIAELAPRVPRDLLSIVAKAMARSADDRYHNAGALAAELRRFQTGMIVHAHHYSVSERVRRWARRRRPVLIGSGAALAGAGGAAVLVMRLAGGAPAPAICKGFELGQVWNQDARREVRDAFIATKLPTATTTFARVETAIDTYTGEWTRSSLGACEATRIRGVETEQTLTLRVGCLDQRRDELVAFLEILRTPKPGLVEKGEVAVYELEPLSRCSDVAALSGTGTAPTEERDAVVALGQLLAEAKAQVIAGQYAEAMALAQQVWDRAQATNWAPIRAEAQLVRGLMLVKMGKLPEAAEALADATWAGMSGKRDDILAKGAMMSALLMSVALGKPAEARIWFALGEAAVKRLAHDPILEQETQQIDGIMRAMSGDLIGAVAAHERAFRLAQERFGQDDPALHKDEFALAVTLTKAFQFRRAAHHLEHAIAMREASVGPEHRDIAGMLAILGAAYTQLREEDKARAAFDRAIAIREGVLGPKSALLVGPLDGLAMLQHQAGDLSAALATSERVFLLAGEVFGDQNAIWHEVATNRAVILDTANRPRDARVLLDKVLALETETSSSILPMTQRVIAEFALAKRDWSEAETFAQRAVTGYEAAGGTSNPELWRPLTVLARAQIELGRTAEARPMIERALAIAGTLELADEDLAATRAALARVAP